jgi:hypothetical protein
LGHVDQENVIGKHLEESYALGFGCKNIGPVKITDISQDEHIRWFEADSHFTVFAHVRHVDALRCAT